MDNLPERPFCKLGWRGTGFLVIFVLFSLAVIVSAVIAYSHEVHQRRQTEFVEKWSKILSLISVKASNTMDENLSIDNEFAFELYSLPSYLDELDIILMVDRANHPVFSAGGDFENNQLIIQSGLRALSGEKYISLPGDSKSDYAAFALPVFRDGEIISAIIMGVHEYDNIYIYGNFPAMLSSLKKSGIMVALWLIAVLLGAYFVKNRLENEENLWYTELRLASMGYSFDNAEQLAKASLDNMITALRLVDGSIYIKDVDTGEITLFGYFSTSRAASPQGNAIFDPADPRLLAMNSRKARFYSISKTGHIRVLERTDRSERNRRLALPLATGTDVFGLLDIGIGPDLKIDRNLISSCERFSERIAESMHGLLDHIENKKRIDEIRHTLDAVETIDVSRDLSDALNKIAKNIIEIKDVRFCRVFTIDEDGTNLVLSADSWIGEGIGTVDTGHAYRLDDMPIHKIAILSGQSQLLRPEEVTTNINSHHDIYHPGMEDCVILIVPLLLEDYQLGCLSVGIKGGEEFPYELQVRLENLAKYLTASINKAQTCQRLKRSFEKLSESQNRIIQNERLSAITNLSKGISEYFDSLTRSISRKLEKLKQASSRDDAAELAGEIKNELKAYSNVSDRFRMFVDIGENGELLQIELAQIINETAKQLSEDIRSYTAPGKEIMMVLKVDGSGQIFGNRENLKTMIRELVINSAEAMPDGGVITIETKVDMSLAVLEVIDQGKGMPDIVKSNLFEPFVTSKEGPGRGLGMSMVYGIVITHGGSIDVSSKDGEGCRITIKIPLVDPEQTALYNVKKGTARGIPLSAT